MAGVRNKFAPLLVGFFFLLHLNTRCQQLFIQKYLAEEYKGGENYAIAQDNEGILYVANSDGIIRFDGSEWSLIAIPKQLPVISMAIDSTGRIYIGTSDELGYLQKDKSGQYTYQSLLSLLPPEQGAVRDIFQTILHGDEVLFRDSEHIYSYKNNKIKVIKNEVSFGEELIVTREHVYSLIGTKVYEYRNYNFELTDFPVKDDFSIKSIVDYAPGKLLILDNKDKLWIFNPTAASITERLILITDKIPSYIDGPVVRIANLKLLDNGLIAVIAEGNIIFVDQHGDLIYHIGPGVLKYIALTNLYEDSHHNLWIPSRREILQINTSSPLSYYSETDGIHHKIISIAEDDRFQYIGTGWGTYYKEKGKIQCNVIHHADGVVWGLYNFSGKVYTAQSSGVYELRGSEAIHLIKQDNVIALCRLKRHPDRMILGTFNTGLWVMKKKGREWIKWKISGFQAEARYVQEDNEGCIWISDLYKGVFRLRLNDATDSVIEKKFFDTSNGLPSNINNRVYQLKSSHKIVITTVNGVYVFNKAKNSTETDKNINGALGKNFCIYTIDEAPSGDLYFWGGIPGDKETAGLLKKQQDGSFKLILTPFNKINIQIKNLRVDVDAPLLVTQNENVLIGNDLRLINYYPLQKTFYDAPVHITIKQVYAGDSLIFHNENQRSVIDLPFFQNNLKFEVLSYTFENPHKMEYQYRIEGFDNQWSDWTHAREVSYTNLSDGDYTFFVRAKNQYDKIGEPITFSFHIRPPWYKTIWAYLAYFVFTVLFISLIVKFYTWRANEQKLKLQRIVNEQNNELLTQNEELSAVNEELSAINEEVHFKNEAISKQAEELKKLNSTKDKLFSIISHDLRGPVIQVQNIFDLVDSNYVSEHELRAMMPRLKENIRQTSSLTENLLYWARTQMDGIQVKSKVFDLRMVIEENFNLFKLIATNKNISLISQVDTNFSVYADHDMIRLVLRNLLSNAIKFTMSGGCITINCKLVEKFTVVTVEDTGIGLTNEEILKLLGYEHFTKYGTSGEKGAGIGFGLCLEFIKKNGGTITVESTLNKGSKFSFTIPSVEALEF